MGHGLNVILQDIAVRYKRMRGHPTLWIPGTDHAGIATQHVVERRLREMGTSRRELGREKFLAAAWKVKEEHHAVISKQLRAMGVSCDWSREAFTLDGERSEAVVTTFIKLYERGALYRGNYLVNWCAHCHTALSDEEVQHHEIAGNLYTIDYPLVDGDGAISVVTTRPETLLGDEAIGVHPDDPRYHQYIGQQVQLPLVNKPIPIIADKYIDVNFGSGALKLTPGHDSNDFDIAQRHDLPIMSVIDLDGKFNHHVPPQFQGLSVADARQAVVAELKKEGYLRAIAPHTHQVGHCYRCSTIIEPLLSEQWFVRMEPLARKVHAAWKRGDFRLYPRRWEATFEHWLLNIRDWCISRQLWWGHRIPVWYATTADGKKEIAHVGLDAPPHTEGDDRQLSQDNDVLDTWFSSWLWPLSILGWPHPSDDFQRYYPTTLLITGYDIIFFWVTRMLMAGLEFTDRTPFREIYLTGLIRDKQGQKMSKSMGNGIDPLEITSQYGADALKFSLAYMMTGGQDIRLSRNDFALGSRFCNKIWNAARFICTLADRHTLLPAEECAYDGIDKWFSAIIHRAISAIDRNIENHHYSEAAHVVYQLVWGDFCDWYLECKKSLLHSSHNTESHRHYSLLIYFFETLLRIVHPFVSFLSEQLYQSLLPLLNSAAQRPYPDALIIAEYPHADAFIEYGQEADDFAEMQNIVTAIRTIRSEFVLPARTRYSADMHVEDDRYALYMREMRNLIEHLTTTTLTINNPTSKNGLPLATSKTETVLHILEHIDPTQQRNKLAGELTGVDTQLSAVAARLQADSPFRKSAPSFAVAAEESRYTELTARRRKLLGFIAALDDLR